MFLDSYNKFYSDGFLGYGEKGDFKYFSLAHFLPIVLLIAAIVLTYVFRDKIKNYKYEKYIRYSLAFLMMLVEMSYYWRMLYSGNPNREDLLSHFPIQVCTISALLTVFLLTTESKQLFDYLAYVVLTLGMVPLITPAVIMNTGPRYYRYYQFFLEHLIPIYSVFYFMFIKDRKIELKNIWKPFVLLVPFGLIAVILNSNIEGANYFYLGTQTDGASIANIMPNNIVLKCFIYAAITISLFLILYGIYYLVNYLVNKYRNKDKEIEEENSKAL